MIASLPMYQRPELVAAHDRYWALIRQALAKANVPSPKILSQDADEFETWQHPELVLSQTCGMPYRNSLHGRVTLIGTPDFGLDGCDPGYYRSALIVRVDDPRNHIEDFATARFAYNQAHSQSGYSAAFHHVAHHGFWFERRLFAGQHLASARAVTTGQADIAAIDAVTWRDVQRYEAFADGLRVLDWTESTPGLPYIARPLADANATFDAVRAAIAGLDDADRLMLGIQGIVRIPAEQYLRVDNPPESITTNL